MKRLILCTLCTLCALCTVCSPIPWIGPRAAQAQSAPQIQVGMDQDVVGVGDVLRVEMSATSGEAMPSDPRPGSTPGFTVRGQNQSPSQTHISINGNRSDRYTLTVDWMLQAQHQGTFTLGPFTVALGGQRFAARPVTVRVVPAGQAGPRRAPTQQQMPSPFGFSPFDPWRNLIPGIDSRPAPAPAPQVVTIDPKLALDAPLGPVYFLHATVDKTNAVVGEQLTFSVLEYRDISADGVEVDEENLHDPQAADFVKHPLMRDDQEATFLGFASIGGRTWVVKVVRRWALFPLHAGDQVIGPMSVSLLRPQSVAGTPRRTETLRIHVTEPPLAGRPPGYAIGDVGKFTLGVEVQPREVEQGGAVGVHVSLAGTGNVPASLTPSARDGVEWLVPEVHGELGPVGHDAYGGKRAFDYVVRLKKAGNIDLGDLTLPFWEPDQKRYQVARAPLGVVHVTPVASAAGSPSSEAEPLLPGLPDVRKTLEGPVAHRRHSDDSALFWAGVAAWPLAFGLAVAGRAAGRRALRAWRTKRASPASDLKERMSSANVACDSADPRGADAAIARALEAATVAHVGVSVRAAVGEEVVSRLENAGVAHDDAALLASLLRECETARFAPDAVVADDAARDAARSRWTRAQGVIRMLEKRG